MCRNFLRLFTAALGVTCLALPASGDDFFVDASLTSGGDDGDDWGRAFRTTQNGRTPLQRALDAAVNTSGSDNIYVADGTYRPTDGTDRTISFTVPANTRVWGGYAGGETDLTQRNEFVNQCILDGDIGTTGVNTDNSYHVVKFTNADYTTTKLSGFIIQKGNASETSGTNSFGGGIIFLGTASDSVSLERLKIRNNNAYSGGGGVFIKQVPGGNLQAYLTNCRFEFNTTNGDGVSGEEPEAAERVEQIKDELAEAADDVQDGARAGHAGKQGSEFHGNLRQPQKFAATRRG